MSQPKWKLLWATDYNLVLEDTTGVYAPEMELAQEYERDDETRFVVYRFDLPRLKREKDDEGNEYIVSEKWDENWPHALSQYPEWFMENLSSVADSIGSTRGEMIDGLTSADVNDRAWAYEAIGGYHGYMNLDGYPLDLSEAELEERWDNLPKPNPASRRPPMSATSRKSNPGPLSATDLVRKLKF